ncbi:MAG: patatin-like phospholipase family protein [Comamonadaceae bacterium]|nr:MAG: patatin-like phospholipase family protein [Comamonadaceae bacterium]
MPSTQRKRLNLALQGGGAHGAYTWGCLERLLDEPELEIGAISGTSAGALNGAALVSGFAKDGAEGAKKRLRQLWTGVAQAGAPLTFFMFPLRKPGMGIWDDVMPLTSPYQANPFGMSPLRTLLDAVIDVEALQQAKGPHLFVNAVNVRTACTRLFEPREMSVDALLASACAPLMFQGVEIDGEVYWDGSYASNPTLAPLYNGEPPDVDILMVELTPLNRSEVPTSAKNILNRINEIASINGLMAELQAIELANRNITGADIRFHVVSMPEEPGALMLEPSVKRTVGMEVFESLRESGYAACGRWLEVHGNSLGVRSSVDSRSKYLERSDREV